MRKVIVLLFLIMFVIGTDVFLISPLIPTLQKLFQVPTNISGWMMGAYAIGYAIFALIAGPLSDGWDRKKVMLSGMVCFSIATFLCGYASSFWSMFLFRFLAGVSAAFTAPQVWATIPTLFPGPKIAKALGIAFAGLAAAQVLGVPIGSWLATIHWSFSFFAIGGFSLLLAISIIFIMPEMKPNKEQGTNTSVLKRYVPLLKSGKARGTYLAYFLFQLGNFSSFSFLGKWITDRFQVSIDQVGDIMIFLGIGTLVGSLCSAFIIHKFNRFNTMLTGILILVLFFIILPHLPSILAISIAYFFISVIFYIIAPPIMEMLISLNPAIRGTISSLSQATMYASITLGSWIAGLLYAQFNGFSAVGIFSAVCFAISLLTFILSGVLTFQVKTKKDLAS
jgi:predicted MFS family arabinose efflux permease